MEESIAIVGISYVESLILEMLVESAALELRRFLVDISQPLDEMFVATGVSRWAQASSQS